jgi:RND family efflux transporter MFP subunit
MTMSKFLPLFENPRTASTIATIAFLAVTLLAVGCNQAPTQKAAKTIEVTVTTPITDQVVDYEDFTGRLDAVKSVDIRARVSGYATAIPFKEGDRVSEGELLVQVDPRPYKALVDAGKAQVEAAKEQIEAARAQASLAEENVALADITYTRALEASKQGRGIVSALELDQDVAQKQVARASLNAARAQLKVAAAQQNVAAANLETAQLNLDWCQVRAPISGLVSRRYIDQGNLIMADNTILTSVVTEDPLYAYFDVDERTFLDLMETFNIPDGGKPSPSGLPVERNQGGKDASGGNWLVKMQFPVLMRLANQEEFKLVGKVNFLDNQVNATTGTIRMRGEFDNPQKTLKKGAFARIRLPIGNPYKTILIPDEAIQSDQGKHYVFIVNEKNVVVYRPVQIGQAIGGLRVIKPVKKDKEKIEGLVEGDRVIVIGMQRVREESPVQVKTQDPPKPPQSSLRDLLIARLKAQADDKANK